MNNPTNQFVLCIENANYPASLEKGKVYQSLPTTTAEAGFLRVIDESGEDYLYPVSCILPPTSSRWTCPKPRNKRCYGRRSA